MSVLVPLLTIHRIEGAWFSEHDQGGLLSSAGCWARYLRFLMGTLPTSGKGDICGIGWEMGVSRQAWFGRLGRWVEITTGGERIKASITPMQYGRSADYRFMVECTTPAIAPMVLLFTDAILERQ